MRRMSQTPDIPDDPFAPEPSTWLAFHEGDLLWRQLVGQRDLSRAENHILALSPKDLQVTLVAAHVHEKDREYGTDKDGLHRWMNNE